MALLVVNEARGFFRVTRDDETFFFFYCYYFWLLLLENRIVCLSASRLAVRVCPHGYLQGYL